jgi:hypothetical protein
MRGTKRQFSSYCLVVVPVCGEQPTKTNANSRVNTVAAFAVIAKNLFIFISSLNVYLCLLNRRMFSRL